MAFVTVRGVSLYYEEHGAANDPPLIMAHGLMGSVSYMQRFAERPADIAVRGVHVIAYDARGHGRSGYTTDRADYHWAALAEDMHGLMLALGLARATVYGGSMGAGTAILLALNHPDAVEKLILQSPPPFGDDLVPVARMFRGLSVLFQLFGTRTAARIVARLPQARGLDPAGSDSLRSFLAMQRRAAVVPAIRGLLLDKPQIPVERFGAIAAPTLVLTHPDDPIHPLSSGETLYAVLPHARLAVAPTAMYWEENAAALTHVVSAFVRGETVATGLPGPKHASVSQGRATQQLS